MRHHAPSTSRKLRLIDVVTPTFSRISATGASSSFTVSQTVASTAASPTAKPTSTPSPALA